MDELEPVPYTGQETHMPAPSLPPDVDIDFEDPWWFKHWVRFIKWLTGVRSPWCQNDTNTQVGRGRGL